MGACVQHNHVSCLHSMRKMFSPSTLFLIIFFAHENMKKPASKVAKPAQIQPKSQFLFHKNLPPHDFSIMTLLSVSWSTFNITRNFSNFSMLKPFSRENSTVLKIMFESAISISAEKNSSSTVYSYGNLSPEIGFTQIAKNLSEKRGCIN